MRAKAEEEGHLSCGGAAPARAPHREGVERKSPSLSPPALQFHMGLALAKPNQEAESRGACKRELLRGTEGRDGCWGGTERQSEAQGHLSHMVPCAPRPRTTHQAQSSRTQHPPTTSQLSWDSPVPISTGLVCPGGPDCKEEARVPSLPLTLP